MKSIDQPREHHESGEAVEPGVGTDNPVAIVLVMCNQGGKDAEQACDEASLALIQDYPAHAK